MPSQYPRLYHERSTRENEIQETRFQGAKPSRLMLVSCTEDGGLHKIENIEGVLGHFVFAREQPPSRRSPFRSVIKAFLCIVLLAGAVAAGAYGNVIVERAKPFLTLLTPVPAVSVPAPTATVIDATPTAIGATVVGATSTVPVVGVQEVPAPIGFSLEEGVGKAVDQIRAGLPRKIDALVSVVGVKNEGTRIIYENKIAMDGAKLDAAKKGKIEEQIVANTCNTPGPRKLLELGVAFRYLYIDKKDKPVMTTDVTKQNCV